LPGGGAAIGGIGALVVTLVAGYLGINPQVANQLFQAFVAPQMQQKAGPGKDDGYKQFAEKVLGTTDKVWGEQFPKQFGERYEKPTLILFDSNSVSTGGCGNVPSAAGPFYCPGDKKLYLNPAFFATLKSELGGSDSQFSQAFVIAHEVGHHLQNLLGYNEKVEAFRRREGENGGIRLELQADYLAGCWAYHGQNQFKFLKDPRKDLQEALQTAKSIGDDAIMKKMGRDATNSSKFNHGTAEQRYFFFLKGFETGDASKRTLDKFFDPNVRPLDLGPKSGF
jgi:predicted metalloprotease